MSARAAVVILGIWLFASAFVWPHSDAQFNNTWILGVLCVAFALIAMAIPAARWLNTLLALWLFASVWVLPRLSDATAWNNALVAVAIFFFSLVSSEAPFWRRPVRGTP